MGLLPKWEPPIAGGFADTTALARGHALRERRGASRSSRRERVPIAIVGGGIAGLSAGWWLLKNGIPDFVILELDDQAGGNSRAGIRDGLPFPWAAHYVPVPGPRASLARELFRDLGVLGPDGWDERALCYAPQERLFMHGQWHEGLEPLTRSSARDAAAIERFDERIAELARSGRFTIPMHDGAPADDALDRMSMADWLAAERLDAPGLRWLVDYACRDDYGALARETSAWAGVHYFAARGTEASGPRGPLTWAEGNGWITKRLLEPLGDRVRTAAPVQRVSAAGRRARVDAGGIEYDAGAVIFAAPSYIAPHVVEDFGPAPDLVTSPWLTAAISLDRWPDDHGAPPAWDNVIHDSPSLGYVVATHQTLRTRVDRSVWTYYLPFAGADPRASREMLIRRPWSEWRDAILADLARAHPDIRRCVSRIDIMRMGHAMPRPVPGFLGAAWRRRLRDESGPVFYGHSDLGGLSLFEEAQHWGVHAASRAKAWIG